MKPAESKFTGWNWVAELCNHCGKWFLPCGQSWDITFEVDTWKKIFQNFFRMSHRVFELKCTQNKWPSYDGIALAERYTSLLTYYHLIRFLYEISCISVTWSKKVGAHLHIVVVARILRAGLLATSSAKISEFCMCPRNRTASSNKRGLPIPVDNERTREPAPNYHRITERPTESTKWTKKVLKNWKCSSIVRLFREVFRTIEPKTEDGRRRHATKSQSKMWASYFRIRN